MQVPFIFCYEAYGLKLQNYLFQTNNFRILKIFLPLATITTLKSINFHWFPNPLKTPVAQLGHNSVRTAISNDKGHRQREKSIRKIYIYIYIYIYIIYKTDQKKQLSRASNEGQNIQK